MKYYKRELTKRTEVNRFGRLGYVALTEYVKTNDIDKFNKGKRIKFNESKDAKRFLLHLEKDRVYELEGETLSRTWG